MDTTIALEQPAQIWRRRRTAGAAPEIGPGRIRIFSQGHEIGIQIKTIEYFAHAELSVAAIDALIDMLTEARTLAAPALAMVASSA